MIPFWARHEREPDQSPVKCERHQRQPSSYGLATTSLVQQFCANIKVALNNPTQTAREAKTRGRLNARKRNIPLPQHQQTDRTNISITIGLAPRSSRSHFSWAVRFCDRWAVRDDCGDFAADCCSRKIVGVALKRTAHSFFGKYGSSVPKRMGGSAF